MRRPKKVQPENHERWLVSYADFITLLFAFFVVMFASSQKDKVRAKEVSEAIQEALQTGAVAPEFAWILGGPKASGQARSHTLEKAPQKPVSIQQPELADLHRSLMLLSAQLRDDVRAGAVQLKLERRGLVISLKAASFFPSGEDNIDPSRYPTIAKVAAVLNQLPNPLRLEGHTDSLPIRNSRFRSNWELSAARSIAMLRLLSDKFDVTRDRMAIVGYAETLALHSNDTEAGRAANRRVDIVVLSEYGMSAEPAAAADQSDLRSGNPDIRQASK